MSRMWNHCLLTINKFSNGAKYISGNRCEKGAGIVDKTLDRPNLIKYKFERTFNYTPLEEKMHLGEQLEFLEY